jgi:hypothetical protein
LISKNSSAPSFTHTIRSQHLVGTRWATIGRIVAWVSLVIAVDIGIGRSLQLGVENLASHPGASEQTQPMEIEYAREACPALNQYPGHPTSIDQLHDLQDQLCPTQLEPHPAGN